MSGNFGNLSLGLGANADNFASVQANYLVVAGGGGGAGLVQSSAGVGGDASVPPVVPLVNGVALPINI